MLAWARGARGATRSIQSFIYGIDELLRWRAVEALGKVCALRAETDLQAVRNLLRQLFWSMNDESGGTGWHSPEAIGEILLNIPGLIDEYGKLMVPFFHEEPFERGAYFAVARLAGIKPEFFMEFREELAAAVGTPDPYIKGYAVMALVALDGVSALDEERIRILKNDETLLTMYDFHAGTLNKISIKEIAGALK